MILYVSFSALLLWSINWSISYHFLLGCFKWWLISTTVQNLLTRQFVHRSISNLISDSFKILGVFSKMFFSSIKVKNAFDKNLFNSISQMRYHLVNFLSSCLCVYFISLSPFVCVYNLSVSLFSFIYLSLFLLISLSLLLFLSPSYLLFFSFLFLSLPSSISLSTSFNLCLFIFFCLFVNSSLLSLFVCLLYLIKFFPLHPHYHFYNSIFCEMC